MIMKTYHKHLLAIAAIIILGILVYSNTVHAPFVFDDEHYITGNPFIKDLNYFLHPSTAKDLKTANTFLFDSFAIRYIGHLTFALNYALHGLNVAGYHGVNLCVHVLNALLVYWFVLLTVTTRQFQTGDKEFSTSGPQGRMIALFSALFFVAHPVQTQAITYITQRFTSLSTMFFLLSLVLYIVWRNAASRSTTPGLATTADIGSGSSRLSPLTYIASVACAILAMKTKEITVTLPIVITLYEYLFFSGPLKKRALFLVPFFFALLTVFMAYATTGEPITQVMRDMNGTAGNRTPLPTPVYLTTEIAVIVTYLRLLFMPIDQNLDYDYPIYHSFFDPTVLLSLFIIGTVLCSAVFLARGHRHPLVSRLVPFGIFWFFITLAVESSVVPIYDVIFEHRMYLPSIGALIAVIGGSTALANRISIRYPVMLKAFAAMAVTALLIVSLAAYERNTVWRTELALWVDVTEKSPHKARGFNNVGHVYFEQGNFDMAWQYFRQALTLDPSYYEAAYNIGIISADLGSYEDAIAYFTQVIAAQPSLGKAYTQRGLAYLSVGDIKQARSDLQQGCYRADESGCKNAAQIPP